MKERRQKTASGSDDLETPTLDVLGVWGVGWWKGGRWNWRGPPESRRQDRREKARAINLRVKGLGIQRESEQGVLLEGGDNITPSSPGRNRAQGKVLCLSRA